MEQNQSQNLSPLPEPQPLNQKHFKAFWPIVIIATLSAIIGGLIVWAAFNAGLDEELNSLLPGADKRLARQHKNVELQPMTSKASENTADWQTYRNEEYGFELKYPKNLDLSEVVVGANSGSKYYYDYVSVSIDTPENILRLKETTDSGKAVPLFSFGAFNPISKEDIPVCVRIVKTINMDGISTKVCKESEDSMGGANQMYLNFTNNTFDFHAQSGSYFNENAQLVDEILSTFKFTK